MQLVIKNPTGYLLYLNEIDWASYDDYYDNTDDYYQGFKVAIEKEDTKSYGIIERFIDKGFMSSGDDQVKKAFPLIEYLCLEKPYYAAILFRWFLANVKSKIAFRHCFPKIDYDPTLIHTDFNYRIAIHRINSLYEKSNLLTRKNIIQYLTYSSEEDIYMDLLIKYAEIDPTVFNVFALSMAYKLTNSDKLRDIYEEKLVHRNQCITDYIIRAFFGFPLTDLQRTSLMENVKSTWYKPHNQGHRVYWLDQFYESLNYFSFLALMDGFLNYNDLSCITAIREAKLITQTREDYNITVRKNGYPKDGALGDYEKKEKMQECVDFYYQHKFTAAQRTLFDQLFSELK